MDVRRDVAGVDVKGVEMGRTQARCTVGCMVHTLVLQPKDIDCERLGLYLGLVIAVL